jgi:hypothetical protein
MDAKRMLKCKNGKRSAEDRDIWRLRIEEVKAEFRLYRQWRREETD